MWSRSDDVGLCQRSTVWSATAWMARPATGGGGVVSTTTTTNVLVASLPLLSCAWQVTVVAPTAKGVPDAGVQLTGTGPSLSSTASAE